VSVRDLGLLVEHLAGITQTADMNACLFEILIATRQIRCPARFVIPTLARDSTCQIKHMEFGRGMTQQVGKVPESLAVLQTKGFSLVGDGPVLALFPEDALLRRMGARSGVTATSRATSGAPRLRCHLNFSGPFGPISEDPRPPNPSTGANPSTNAQLCGHFSRIRTGTDTLH